MENKKIKSKNLGQQKFNQNLLEKYPLPIFIFLSLIVSSIIFKNFFFGDFLYFFKDIGSDTINITLPNFIEGQRLTNSEGYFKTWSFYSGMGRPTGNALSLDPFIFIFKILKDTFGINALYYRIFIIYFLYILPSGIVAFYYFKTLGLKNISLIIGGLLFEFSGYMIIGSQWGHAYKIFFFIFYIFSFEQILVKNRWYFFPFAVFFQAANLYLLATNTLFLFIYSIVRYFENENSSIKNYLFLLLKMAGLGLLGIALNAPRAWTNFSKMFFSPRVSGSVNQTNILLENPEQFESSLRNITTILRFYANDLLGTGSNFKGWYNYLEAPIFYIGLLPLLIFSSVFIFVNKRKKILFGLLLSFWFIVAFTPTLRHSINFFMGNYFKNTIDVFVPFTILFTGIYSFNKFLETDKKINPLILIITAGIQLLLLHYPYFEFNNQIINFNMKLIISLFIIVYTLLLYLISQNKKLINLKYLFLLFLVIELVYIDSPALNNRDIYLKNEIIGDNAGYNDITIDAIEFIYQNDNEKFFRIEKDYSSGNSIHGSLNDAKAQGYFGTTSYSSFNQLNYIKFLQEIEVIEKGSEAQTRWNSGVRGIPLMMTFASVKYFITEDFNNPLRHSGYDSIATFENVIVLENKNFLPIGFTYDKYLLYNDFSKLNKFKKQQALLKAIVIDDIVQAQNLKPFDTNELEPIDSFSVAKYIEMIDSLKTSSFNITDFKHKQIKGNITIKKSGMLFFTIPYDEGWTIFVNGVANKPLKSNIGFMSIYLEQGNYELVLERKPQFFILTLSLAIISLLTLTFVFYKIFRKQKALEVN